MVGSAAPVEDDAMVGGEAGDVDGVIIVSSVDGNGREVEARPVEVSDHDNCVAAGRAAIWRIGIVPVVGGAIKTVDGDFLDVVELGDDAAVPRHYDLGVGIETGKAGMHRAADAARVAVPMVSIGVDRIRLRTRPAGDHETVASGCVGATVDEVMSVRRSGVVRVPQDRVVTGAREHDVVAGPRIERRRVAVADEDIGRIAVVAVHVSGSVSAHRHIVGIGSGHRGGAVRNSVREGTTSTAGISDDDISGVQDRGEIG